LKLLQQLNKALPPPGQAVLEVQRLANTKRSRLQ